MDVRLTRLGDLAVPVAVVPAKALRLEEWIAGQRAWLRETLLEHGALLFRGFGISDPQRLAAVLQAAGFPLMDYPPGTSPRTEVGERIYTSTETRPDVPIPLHSEMSYERAAVERLCAAQGISCDWLEDGSLSITGQCPALRPHPRSGERVWFNQAHVFHMKLFHYLEKQGVSDAREQARDFAERHARPLEPYQCWFGGGGEISRAAMQQVRKAIEAETQLFDWQAGDLLLLDGFRVAHGRDAFRGSRRVLAALVARLWEN